MKPHTLTTVDHLVLFIYIYIIINISLNTEFQLAGNIIMQMVRISF